jgi:uncharacterized RDD family membrane protein YckC
MFSILGGDGKEYGPVAVAKIQEWIAGGRANLQTKAKRAGDAEWRTLGEFPEFNGAPADPAAPGPATPAAALAPLAATPVAVATSDGSVLADPGLRLVAALLDSLIGLVMIAPGFGLLAAAGVFNEEAGNEPNTPFLLAGVCALGLAMLILLIVQIYLLVTRGQTIGKKIVKVKIVAFETGQNAGFTKVILLRGFVNGLIGCVPVVGGIYSLVDVLFIFRADRRCIHDLLAGTKVVKA